jgi:hypothetical protein
MSPPSRRPGTRGLKLTESWPNPNLFSRFERKARLFVGKGSPAMRTTVLAYVIAAVGIVMLIFGHGACSF